MTKPPTPEIDPALEKSSHRGAIVFLLIGAVLISLSGVWVKAARVDASTSAFHRVFLGGIMLLALVMARGEARGIGWRHMRMGLLSGLLFGLDLFLYHKSILLVGPGLGTILPNFQVFLLAAFGFAFMGESIRLAYVLSVPCAITGLFMIVGFDWSSMSAEYVSGIWYGLACAVIYAFYILSLRKTQSMARDASMFLTMAIVSLSAAGFLGLEAWSLDIPLIVLEPRTILSLLALALFSQVVGWTLIATNLPRIQASVAGVVLLLQPALAFVWDCLLFHRETSALNWLGLFVVLTAIYFATAKPRPRS